MSDYPKRVMTVGIPCLPVRRSQILEFARQHTFVLVSEDTDFGDGSLTMITLEVQLGRLLGYAVGSQLGYDAVQGAKVTRDTARDLAGRRCAPRTEGRPWHRRRRSRTTCGPARSPRRQ